MAAAVDNLPLGAIILQTCSIGGEIRKLKVMHAPLEAFADLAAHLAETWPAQVDLRQRPLQEGRAIRIVHAIASSMSMRPHKNKVGAVCSMPIDRRRTRGAHVGSEPLDFEFLAGIAEHGQALL